MIRHMLVPLDGSALAEASLPAVRELSRLTGASVTVLQVVEPPEPLADLIGTEYPEVELDLQIADEGVAHAYVTDVATRLNREGLVAHTRVMLGQPAEIIIQIAGEFDLVAMATHGRSGLGRWVYGSTADKVLRGAPVPVLLVRAQPDAIPVPGPFRRILVPLDGSDLAEHALPLASVLAQRAEATLVLTRGISWAQEFVGANAYLGGYTAINVLDLAAESARDYLSQVAQRLTAQGLTVRTDIRVEPAADGILASAADHQADLIVMSTHGRGGLGRWVYGSVADRVLRAAELPVLLVRASVPVDDGVVSTMAAGVR